MSIFAETHLLIIKEMTEEKLTEIKKRIIEEGYAISEAEAMELATYGDKKALYAAADEIRKKCYGDFFDTCSIINARSGRCSEDCKWCAQSGHAHDTGCQVYEFVDREEAVEMAIDNGRRGVNRFSLVTSGRKISDKNLDEAISIYNEIAEKSDIKLCASMGLLTKEQLQRLKDSGVGHYHCNIETAPSFFPKLCTTHTIEDKVRTIEWAKEVGLKICSGGIIGMGETMEQRIEMAMFLRKLGVASIPVNILMPIKGTKLENQPPLTNEEIFTTFALFRFINPKALIRMAGGRKGYKSEQSQALHAGINASIVGDMLTTTGAKSIEEDTDEFKKEGYSLTE